MATMYDAVDVSNIPKDATIVAGYVDGRYANFNELVNTFPDAQHVSITVTGSPWAMVADIEGGDLTPAEGAAWAKRAIAEGHRPTLYCSQSEWTAVIGALGGFGPRGIPDVDFWIAEWTGIRHRIAGTVATQWSSSETFDISETDGIWPAITPPTPPGGIELKPLYVTNSAGTGFVVAADLSSKTAVVSGNDAAALLATGLYEYVAQGKLSDAQIAAIPNA
jgi:hypothetical protein